MLISSKQTKNRDVILAYIVFFNDFDIAFFDRMIYNG